MKHSNNREDGKTMEDIQPLSRRLHCFYIWGATKIFKKVNNVIIYTGETKDKEQKRVNKHLDGNHGWMMLVEDYSIPSITKKSEIERGYILMLKKLCNEYDDRVELANVYENKDCKPYYILNKTASSSSPLDIGEQASTDSPWNGGSSTLREYIDFALNMGHQETALFDFPEIPQYDLLPL